MQLMESIKGDVVKFLLNLYSAINVVFRFLKYYLSGVFHYKFTDMLFFLTGNRTLYLICFLSITPIPISNDHFARQENIISRAK